MFNFTVEHLLRPFWYNSRAKGTSRGALWARINHARKSILTNLGLVAARNFRISHWSIANRISAAAITWHSAWLFKSTELAQRYKWTISFCGDGFALACVGELLGGLELFRTGEGAEELGSSWVLAEVDGLTTATGRFPSWSTEGASSWPSYLWGQNLQLSSVQI